MPEANALIRTSVFEPEAFNAAIEAFDEGWASVRYLFAGQPQSMIDDARTALAKGVVNAAQAGHTTADVLKQEGIRVLKAAYPQIPI
jgi:hypothetical protein